MPVQALNEHSSLDTVRPQGRVVVLNASSRNLPKAGKNGTSSLFSHNLDHAETNQPVKRGNAFGNNDYRKRSSVQVPEKQFGQRSNVAIATGGATAPRYTSTDGPHPNAHFFDVARQPKRAPTQPGSPTRVNVSQPAGVFKQQANPATTVMPFQRNGIGANQGKNLSKRAVIRASAGGANKTLPSDTAFKRMPVKRAPSVTQVTGVPQAPDTSSHFRGKVSFVTRNNVWYDPNNSFTAGTASASSGRTGTGRWNIIKRGAAG